MGLKISRNFNIEKYQDNATKFIKDNWFNLHLLFIVVYLLYIILKIYKIKVLPNNGVDLFPSFSLPWFFAGTIGFSSLAIVLVYLKGMKLWLYIVVLFFGFSLITISYVNTVDPDLEWYGSDVALGNMISAEEMVKLGTFDLIKTWNDRANPYEYSNHFTVVKDSIIQVFNKYNLSGLLFDNWKNKLDSNSYNIIHNNRPYVHSPFPTIIMGWWLKIFPFGRWSLECQMLFLNFISLLLVIIFAFRKVPENYRNLIVISLASSLVMFKFHSPSVDQLSMFLFTLPLFLSHMFSKKNFLFFFLNGVVYGFCFYSKFTVLSFILLLIISFLFYRKELTLKSLIGLLSGLLIPVIIFTASGYYFWITLITGRIITQIVARSIDLSFMESLTKLLYFGPSFLLLTLILIINFNRVSKNSYPYYVPTMLSLVLLLVFLYDQGGWNRYLTQYMPVILLFVCSIDSVILELKKKDLLISIIVNYIFLNLNAYF